MRGRPRRGLYGIKLSAARRREGQGRNVIAGLRLNFTMLFERGQAKFPY